MRRKKIRIFEKMFLAICLICSIAVFPHFYSDDAVVKAHGGLVLSTSYTGITVKAGDNVKFPINIENVSVPSGSVELSIQSIPEGWDGYFEGEGNRVHKVFLKTKSDLNVDLKLKVPSDVSEGEYTVVIAAKSANAKDTLSLNLKVSEQTISESKFVAQYPELQGPGDAAFKFRLDLTNNREKDQSYSLGAQAPRGWEVSFKPSFEDKQIASISLEPDDSQGLDVEVKPANQVKAGEYTIPITAVSAEEQLTTELKVVISGTYDISLSTPSGRLNAEVYAGKEEQVNLSIVNNGSADLKGISLTSEQPKNWTVRFEPAEIDVLQAGESKQVKAYIKPDAKAIAGDYVVSLKASTPEAGSDVEMRVMVKTSTIWGLVGIVIIILLLYGLYWVFKKYGRR
ncbi:MAG: NEW3 domain-containing protein [Clostridia bacterium]|nr:NEW3 domain-containing protein [Clostridia bacterium]